MAAMACHDGFGEGKYVQSAAPAKQGYKKCPPRPQPGGLDVPIVHCSVFEEGTLLLAAKRHSNPLPGKWQNRDVRINHNKPMGSHGSFAGDTCRIMWHFAHFGGDDSKSVTDWNRCFNQSWRQCQEENKLYYTTIHSRKLTTSQVTASIPWAAKGAVLGSGVRLERRKVDCLERRKVDRLEPGKVTPTET